LLFSRAGGKDSEQGATVGVSFLWCDTCILSSAQKQMATHHKAARGMKRKDARAPPDANGAIEEESKADPGAEMPASTGPSWACPSAPSSLVPPFFSNNNPAGFSPSTVVPAILPIPSPVVPAVAPPAAAAAPEPVDTMIAGRRVFASTISDLIRSHALPDRTPVAQLFQRGERYPRAAVDAEEDEDEKKKAKAKEKPKVKTVAETEEEERRRSQEGKEGR